MVILRKWIVHRSDYDYIFLRKLDRWHAFRISYNCLQIKNYFLTMAIFFYLSYCTVTLRSRGSGTPKYVKLMGRNKKYYQESRRCVFPLIPVIINQIYQIPKLELNLWKSTLYFRKAEVTLGDNTKRKILAVTQSYFTFNSICTIIFSHNGSAFYAG